MPFDKPDTKKPAANPEQELVGLAKQSDDLEAQASQGLLAGDYSPETVGLLIDALNRVLPLFGEEALADKEIAPAVVKAMQMVKAAAEDAGMESPDLAAMDDAELEMVIGVLEQLATSPEFKRFLKSRAPEAEQKPAAEPAAPPAPAGGEEDLDALFAGRMG